MMKRSSTKDDNEILTVDNEEPPAKRQKMTRQKDCNKIDCEKGDTNTLNKSNVYNYKQKTNINKVDRISSDVNITTFEEILTTLLSIMSKKNWNSNYNYLSVGQPIPVEILTIIAQYSIGTIVPCTTAKCDRELLLLTDTHKKKILQQYIQCGRCNRYYCQKCCKDKRSDSDNPFLSKCKYCKTKNVCSQCSITRYCYQSGCERNFCGGGWESCKDCISECDYDQCFGCKRRFYCDVCCETCIKTCDKCDYTFCILWGDDGWVSGCKQDWKCENDCDGYDDYGDGCNEGVCHNCDANKCCICGNYVKLCNQCAEDKYLADFKKEYVVHKQCDNMYCENCVDDIENDDVDESITCAKCGNGFANS